MKSFTTTAFLTVLVSLLTLAGLVLHDTRIDRLARTFWGIPAAMAVTEGFNHSMKTDDHTHVERISLNETKSQQPRLAPRYLEQKKHVLPRGVPKGTRIFDSYSIPA